MGVVNKNKRLIIHGTPLSHGFAIGRAFFYEDILSRNTVVRSIAGNRIDEEMARILTAMSHVSDGIDVMRRDVLTAGNTVASSIFAAQKEMINDKQLAKDLKGELDRQHVNAEQIVKNVFRRLADKLQLSDSEIIRSKVDDVEDLSLRVLRILTGHEWNPLSDLPENSIIIAKRLLPLDTVHIKRKNLKGIIVENGSSYSHSAILAKSFGITCITDLNIPLDRIKFGEQLILDGSTGIIIVNPTEKDIVEHKAKKTILRKNYSKIREHTEKPVKTKKGKHIRIYANAFSEDDFRLARENSCDGIGLVRLEQLYMFTNKLPTEDEIINELSNKFQSFSDKNITVRLLDIGGDKSLPYLKLKPELNPSLGLRGIRFLLKYKHVLKPQLRAIYKLNEKFNLNLLIPMVTTVEDIETTKNILSKCRKDIEKECGHQLRDISIGAMLETPSAFMHIEEIVKHVSFVAVGTNDLIQYMMVACRESPDVVHYYEKGYALVVKMIGQIIDKNIIDKNNIYVCGELVSNPDWLEKLLKSGVTCISVPSYSIPEIKEAIRSVQ